MFLDPVVQKVGMHYMQRIGGAALEGALRNGGNTKLSRHFPYLTAYLQLVNDMINNRGHERGRLSF